ncbi:MAG: PAC2 family protein, partial [Planctomycetales bacterium]|nr:PAC2 family protein [Planctomycetales bacterium]
RAGSNFLRPRAQAAGRHGRIGGRRYNAAMNANPGDPLTFQNDVRLEGSTLVLAFTGWMDGGDVSTGTVSRLVELLGAEPFAEIDAEPFTIYNLPGSMEVAALFRPRLTIEDGLVQSMEMPSNVFYVDEDSKLFLLLGKEPHLNWRLFGDAVFRLAKRCGVSRMLFVGSFGGPVPHTRQPRLYVACSDASLLPEMEQYGMRRTGYAGPGSFSSYLLSRAADEGVQMSSLVVEIPGYLQGANPLSIEAVSRRLAKILQLSLDLDELRAASTQWELQISNLVEQNEEFAGKVRELEQQYDNDLLDQAGEG